METMHNPTFEMVLDKYRKLAYNIANDFRICGLPMEDLRQESILGLYKAYERFHCDRGTRFSTYAVYWIKKQILEAIKQEIRHKPKLSDVSPSHRCSQVNHTSNLDKLDLPIEMPDLEKRILQASYVQQQSLQEIAKDLGLKVEKVKQHKQKALRRLRSLNYQIKS